MRSFVAMCTIGLVFFFAIDVVDAQSDSQQSQSPYIAITDLGPQFDGKEVTIRFVAKKAFRYTGARPPGPEPFGIEPELTVDSPRVQVLVTGELADVMARFGMLRPPTIEGLRIQATGKISVLTTKTDSARLGPTIQFTISDWKSFRIIPKFRGRGTLPSDAP